MKVHELHIIYGPVVRIAPNELAYSSSQAWKDIYGYQNGKEEIPKFARFYNALTDVPNIVTEPTRFHQVIRRIISPGFSDKCLREQEPILKGYIELLTNQLESNCCDAKGRRLPVDINTWFNSLAFDIAGDLTFGKSFGSLLKGFEDPWVANINSFTGIGLAVILTAAHLGGITLVRILTKLVQSGQQKHITAMTQTLNERIESKTARSDWINELIIAKDGEECYNYTLFPNTFDILINRVDNRSRPNTEQCYCYHSRGVGDLSIVSLWTSGSSTTESKLFEPVERRNTNGFYMQ